MGLADVIAAVREREQTLTVFNPGDHVVEELRAHLADRNVSIRTETSASGRPAGFAVLERDGTVVTAIDVDDLLSQLGDGAGADTSTGAPSHTAAPQVVRHLGEETFTSYDRDQMLAATREIEDRAYRVGEGTLRAGFQTVDRLRDERERYDSLADRGLDVTVYAVPGDGGRPVIPDVDIHTPETAEIADHWFVAFRGNGPSDGEGQHSALLAEQRPSGFFGIWTYDPAIVDRIHAHLRERYDRAAAGT